MKKAAFYSTNNLKPFKMSEKAKYMTVKDYADKFGITVQTVYNKIKNKELETKTVLNTTLVKL